MHALDRLDPLRHRNRHDQRRWHGAHLAHASGCCVRRPLGCDRTWLPRGCAARRHILRDLVRCPASPLACVQPFVRESCCVCKRHQPARLYPSIAPRSVVRRGRSLRLTPAPDPTPTRKEWLFRITHAVGTRTAAPTLVANAFHHRSDALSSVAAIGGVGGAHTHTSQHTEAHTRTRACPQTPTRALNPPGAMLGFGYVDLLAALMVGGMVLSMGLEVGSDALRQLLRARRAVPAADGVAGGLARLDEMSLPHLGQPAHLTLSEADADAAATGGRKAHVDH